MKLNYQETNLNTKRKSFLALNTENHIRKSKIRSKSWVVQETNKNGEIRSQQKRQRRTESLIAPINQENHAEEEEEEEGYNIKRGLDVFDNIRRALMVCELVVAVPANKVDCFLHEFFSQKQTKQKNPIFLSE